MEQEKRVSAYQESQFVAGDANGTEPMTAVQATHLKTLADEVQDPGAFQQGLTRREAARRIDVLLEKIRLGELPPHTD